MLRETGGKALIGVFLPGCKAPRPTTTTTNRHLEVDIMQDKVIVTRSDMTLVSRDRKFTVGITQYDLIRKAMRKSKAYQKNMSKKTHTFFPE